MNSSQVPQSSLCSARSVYASAHGPASPPFMYDRVKTIFCSSVRSPYAMKLRARVRRKGVRDAFEPSKGSGAAIRIWTWAEGVSAMLGSIGERVGDGGDEVVGVVTGEGVGTRACQKWVAVV